MKKKIVSVVLTAAMLLSMSGVTVLASGAENNEVRVVTAAEEGNPLRLWYDKPTSQGDIFPNMAGAGISGEDNIWQQLTLPIGNGDMGANIYGDIASERLTFNEKTLWTGGPSASRTNYQGGNVESKGRNGEAMKEIQAAFAAGNTASASSLCDANLVGISDGYGAYQSWGNIYFDYQDITESDAQNYVRDLDMKTAISTVKYQIGGTQYSREYFISNPDNVLAAKLSADGTETLNLDVRFPSNQGGTTIAEGTTLKLAGEVSDNQMKYDSILKVVNDGGTVTATSDGKLQVRGAKAITVYVSAATDYKNDYPVYRTGEGAMDLHTRVLEVLDKAVDKGYEAVKGEHIKDYSQLFERVDLDLEQTVSSKPTDELLVAYKAGSASEAERRQLEVMLFQYGRYLTLASSRENSQLPANLQGVWNNKNTPAWASDYHMNVNLQMNYWPTYVTNLAECAKPLVSYVDSLREPGRVTAKIYAGIESTEENPENGFMAHTQNTPFGWTCPGWAFSWGWSPAAVPWILQNCWDYYDFTRDEEYLESDIYPAMKEEARLYDQMLIEDENGELISSPTYSPEHGPYTAGNTYEQSLIWQLYEDTMTAGEVLGEDQALLGTWASNQENLKGPVEIGDDGQIKEWYTETTIGSVSGYDSAHRHLSHMLGLFPGDLISVETPELLEAAKVSMNNRPDSSTGWGMGQRINTWARLGDGDRAYKLITDLFAGGIYKNLWDSHAPFQIDGNFGMTSGVAEMLIQSNVGYIHLLPSLPSVWSEGHVDGLVARGNFEVDMDWAEGKLEEAVITAHSQEPAVVQYENISLAAVTDETGAPVEFTVVNDSRDRITFQTEEGKTYTISQIPSSEEDEKAEAPGNLAVYKTRMNQAELTWKTVAGTDVTYNVYRRIAGGEQVQIAEGITDASYTDTEAYDVLGEISYQVSAVTKSAESKISEAVSMQDMRNATIDDRDSRVVYSGGWGDWDESVNYNGTIKYLESPEGTETATLTFYGNGIEVITCANFDRGFLEITIDGVSYGTVDTYSSTTQRQKSIFEKTDLTKGEHTIVVRATNEKNPESSRTKVELDGFKVYNNGSDVEEEITEGVAAGVESSRLMLLWPEVAGAEAYKIYNGTTLVTVVTDPYTWITELESGTEYTFTVKSVVGQTETEAAVVSVKTLEAADEKAPSQVTGLKAVQGKDQVTLTWNASTDTEGSQVRYLVYVNGEKVTTTDKTEYILSGLEEGKVYHVRVAATDNSGNTAAAAAVSFTRKQAEDPQPQEQKIRSVGAVSEISVKNGTTFGQLNLPGKVAVTLDTEPVSKELAVTWNPEGYDGTKAGTYTLTGNLTLPAGIVNPDGKTATVTVKVAPPETNLPIDVISVGQVVPVGSYLYKITSTTENTVTLTGINKGQLKRTLKKLVVGNTVTIGGKSYKVTAVAPSAFKNYKSATLIVIGKNVKEIGNSAFLGCSKVKKVTMNSKTLRKIGSKAFYNCKALKTMTIKSTALKSVGKKAFRGIYKKAVVKVLSKKLKAYKKLFKGKGLSSSAKIKK